MDWFDVAQDRERWLALVNRVMKQRIPKDCGRRSYILHHCDFTSCFISVYNLLLLPKTKPQTNGVQTGYRKASLLF